MRSSDLTAVACLLCGFVIAVPAARAAEPLCAAMLTAAELKAASGRDFDSGDPVSRDEGWSECSWFERGAGDSGMTVTVTYWNTAAIRAGLVPADSPREFFEMNASSTEQTMGSKREALAAIGVRAALFGGEQQTSVFIETKAGVAHVMATGLGEPQVVAVAKAVAQGQ